MFESFKNKFLYKDKYKTHPEAIIISCYYNPLNSPYRLKSFNEFYKRIKHLNHFIYECVIGDSQAQLKETDSIKHLKTPSLLWHKEAILNKIIKELPSKYKYIFWIDTDVVFTNLNWMIDGVEQLKTRNLIQPFEYCVHLDKDETKPSFSLEVLKSSNLPNKQNSKVWRSFASNFVLTSLWKDENYNNHGHVGFAWGARRDVLDKVKLYDKALIGGADHIIAHAAAGQINHNCISNAFKDDIENVNIWSKRFYDVVQGKIGYVYGDLYHIWHGDLDKRQYLKRIQDFTAKSKKINKQDKNGLYTYDDSDDFYFRDYYRHRETWDTNYSENHTHTNNNINNLSNQTDTHSNTNDNLNILNNNEFNLSNDNTLSTDSLNNNDSLNIEHHSEPFS